MISKVKAVKSTMSFGIILTQFIIGLSILANIFSSNKIVDNILSNGGNFSPSQGSRSPMTIDMKQIEAPVRFLFVILGFILFSVILFTLVPKITEKQGRKMRPDFELE